MSTITGPVVLLEQPHAAMLSRIGDGAPFQIFELVLAEECPADIKAEAEALIPATHRWVTINADGDALLGCPAYVETYWDSPTV